MRKIDVCVLLCCVCIIFTRCTDHYVTGEDETAPRIGLLIPAANDVTVYSSASPRENFIEDCCVVAFKSNGDYRDAELIDVSKIINNGGDAALLPQLSFRIESGDKLYVICNTGLTALPNTITEANINSTFKPAKDYYFEGDALPMSGSLTYAINSDLVVTLTRAVAKVQVKLGDSYDRGDHPVIDAYYRHNWNWSMFQEDLCGFIICNYGGRSNIMPDPSSLSKNEADFALHNISSHNTGDFYAIYDKCIRFMQYAPEYDPFATDVTTCASFYISEYPSSQYNTDISTPIPDNQFDEKRIFMLMMSEVVTSRSPALPSPSNTDYSGMWRLDFYDAATKKYIDIKRNHTYTFTINKIRSAPYFEETRKRNYNTLLNNYPDTPTNTWEAQRAQVLHNPGSNIEYTIAVEDDWAHTTYSNGQYALFVSADTIRDTITPFTIRGYVPAGINVSTMKHEFSLYDSKQSFTMLGNSGTALQLLDENGNALSPQNFWEFPIDGTSRTVRFRVHDSHPDVAYLDGAYMHINFGNIRRNIPVKLYPYPNP
jgi:hypothetical protein